MQPVRMCHLLYARTSDRSMEPVSPLKVIARITMETCTIMELLSKVASALDQKGDFVWCLFDQICISLSCFDLRKGPIGDAFFKVY